MGKIAFVFAGQGAQYPGMGRSLCEASPAAKAVFAMADAVRPGTSRQCFEGTKEELTVTLNTQPCLFCVDLAAAEALREAGISPDLAAGFSLGEVAALAFTGGVSKEDCFAIVCKRAARMQAAAEETDAAMAAVVKLPNEKVEELCQAYSAVYPVNYNCPGQLVVAGRRDQLDGFREDVRAAGGKAIPLAVGGGFHSPFMDGAAETFAADLQAFSFAAPRIPLIGNALAEPYAGDLPALLVRQMKSPVRWQSSVERMLDEGVDTFVEVGPGKTLCGLIKKIAPSAALYQVEDAESLQMTIEAVKNR